MGWLCCPGIVWECNTIREKSSHAFCQGTLIRSHLSTLSHCVLILNLREWSWCMRADLHFLKKKVQVGNDSSKLPLKWLHSMNKPHTHRHKIHAHTEGNKREIRSVILSYVRMYSHHNLWQTRLISLWPISLRRFPRKLKILIKCRFLLFAILHFSC